MSQCCEEILTTLTEEETILVNIVYWARNKRFPRDYVFRNNFYHGPHGHKALSHSKKSWSWLPNPAEGCDNLEVGITEVDSKPDASAKPKFNPWTWFIHCKSYSHIAYLVKHRKHFLLNHHFDIRPFETAYKSFTKLTLEEKIITNPFPLESTNPLPFDYTMDTLNVEIRPHIYFYCDLRNKTFEFNDFSNLSEKNTTSKMAMIFEQEVL